MKYVGAIFVIAEFGLWSKLIIFQCTGELLIF